MITYAQRIYDFPHKHFNYCAAYYTPYDKLINPKMILRFDCKQINSIQVLRIPIATSNIAQENGHQLQTPGSLEDKGLQSESSKTADKKVLFLIAACNDNYIRFFNM